MNCSSPSRVLRLGCRAANSSFDLVGEGTCAGAKPPEAGTMIALNYAAIVAAAVLVFVFAAVYYSVLSGTAANLGAGWAQRSRPSAWLLGLELLKALVVATIVAALVAIT